MSFPVIIGVGLLGGVGAVARFLLDGEVSRRVAREFPYGTFAVNISGAFALGLLVGVSLGKDAYTVAGTGLVGGFTTFSTWAFESHRLGEDNRLSLGLVNFVASLLAGLAAAAVGRHLGAIL